MNKLSIVIPIYYNEQNIWPLYNDIKEKIIDIIDFDYELIFVDDGSEDGSWEVLNQVAEQDSHMKLIRLSRNFGSHAAILCGLKNSSGDCVAIKAADLQEPTELILDMYAEWRKGYNVVLAVREDREDKSFFSDMYYRITRKFALPNMPIHGFDTFLVDKKVIEVLSRLDEQNSAITGQILWSGFRTKEVPYIRKKREIGKSKWTLRKKIRLVTNTLFSFSTVPITIVTTLGVISCTGATIWAILLFITKLSIGIEVEGYTSLFVFQLFSFGVVMMTLGLLGGYLWRTFDASRNRPVYIIEDLKDEGDRK